MSKKKMTNLSQREPVQMIESPRFSLTNKEKDNGRQIDVTSTMERNENEDSGIQEVPSLSDVDTDGEEVQDFYPEADVKSEEETDVERPESEQTSNTAVDQFQTTAADQHVSHVVVCSPVAVDNAKLFQHDLVAESPNADIHVITCCDKDDFEHLLTAYTSIDKIYILADSRICDAMLKKRILHESISELFEKLVETSTVYLVRRVSDGEWKQYTRLQTQLPDSVLEHKEILVSTENRAIVEQVQQLQAQDQNKSIQTGTLNKANNTQKDFIQQNNIMIGSKCKMDIQKSDHQFLAIRQDGSHNIVNVQIVPATTTSKLQVVIRTDPSNPDLERRLVQEVRDDEQIINICLSHFDGKLVLIDQGSIVIELDIAPGRTIGFDYLQDVLGAIFQGDIKDIIPDGSNLTVDADVQNVIPLSKLQEYFSGYTIRDEDLHANCVAKDKYEDAIRQLESVTKELEYLRRKVKHETGCLRVTVVSGDITEEETDVLVNSTNPQLLLSDGDLSGDILKAAGTSIQTECRKQNPSKLKVGDLAVTRGGNLSCKQIYHVVLGDTWVSRQKEAEFSLRAVLNKCLQEADGSGHNSISFPALGMGKLKYDPQTVVPLMYDVIMKFKPTALEEVRFVILPKFSQIHQVFSDKDKIKTLGRSYSEPANLDYGKYKTLSGPKVEVEEQLQVKWIKADISHLKVDVVVNTTDKRLNLESGPISQAVLKAAGINVQEECRQSYPQGIAEGQLALTSGGKLCNYILHISLWPWTDEFSLEKGFMELIGSILREADDRGQTSIAFPMLGTGTLKYPPETVAGWLSGTFDAEMKRSSSLREIYVVVHPKDSKNIEALKHLGKLT